jgi:hypothetical protein
MPCCTWPSTSPLDAALKPDHRVGLQRSCFSSSFRFRIFLFVRQFVGDGRSGLLVARRGGDLAGQDVDDGVRSGPEPQLGQHALDLEAHDLLCLTYAVGDLAVGEPVGDQSEQALLTLGQALVQPVAFDVAQTRSSSFWRVQVLGPGPGEPGHGRGRYGEEEEQGEENGSPAPHGESSF